MATELIQVKVQKSGHQIMQHLCRLLKAYEVALKDGWQPGQDVPVMVMAVVAEGPGLMSQIPQVGADWDAGKVAFLRGVVNGACDVADLFIKEAPPVAPPPAA